MIQTVLSFVAAIDPARVVELKATLADIAADPCGNSRLPFGRNPSLHFSSMVIFERRDLDPNLIWENNFDGDLNSYLKSQLEVARVGLNEIYGCCRDYPGPDRLEEYLRARAVPAGLYYIGAVGRSVTRIKGEALLRAALRDRLRVVSAASAVEAARNLRGYVLTQPCLAWAITPVPLKPAGQQIAALFRTALAALVAIPAMLVLLPIIRGKEFGDHEDHDPIPHDKLQRLLASEDRTALNHMASFTRVKPGRVRLLFLRLLLWFGNIYVRTQSNGTLNGIPGIHYAHWSLIDSGRWLMFLSNYTGSWTSYLDDFIERASEPLSLLWSNTGGFPRTRWLIFDGARNGPLFKTYARNSMSETLVWYSAYPKLTLQNVNKNSEIRNRLSAESDSEEKQSEWLVTI